MKKLILALALSTLQFCPRQPLYAQSFPGSIYVPLVAKDNLSASDMTPRSATVDKPDKSIRNAENPGHRSKRLPAIAEPPNFFYLIFGQFGRGEILAFWMLAAISGLAIRRIVRIRSRIQMVRAEAWRIVALVQNVSAIRYRAMRQLVCHAVRAGGPSWSGSDSDESVACRISASRPLHASVIPWDLLKHLFEQVKAANLVSHLESPPRLRCMALSAFARCGATLILASSLSFSQSSPAFPGAIYTPLVARDNLQTTLTTAMAAGDTTAFVASTTRWVANTVLYICDTTVITGGIARCSGTYEAMLVTAVPGANALTVTRGFGGTSAIAHASGKAAINAPVSVYNTWVNNEVLAIENALGVNMANVAAAPPGLNSSAYNFATQSPTSPASLIIGNNTVSMSPCPLGVAGTHTVAANLPHKIYVFGTGTPEAAFITGGTCTSGATTGTLIINTANTHAAGYQIKSASTGAQEAVYAAGATGQVSLACGTLNIYGTLYVPNAYSTSVRGCGMRVTALVPQFTTGDVFVVDYVNTSAYVDVGDFQILDGNTHTTGAMLKVRYRTDGIVSNILTANCYDCVIAEGDQRVLFSNIVGYTTHYGFTITCAGVSGASCASQGGYDNIHVISNAGSTHGLHVQDQTTGLIFTKLFIEQGAGGVNNYAAYFNVTAAGPLNEIVISDSILDSHTTCLGLVGNGGTYNNNSFQLLNTHVACTNFGVQTSSYFDNLRIGNNYIGAAGSGTPLNTAAISLGANTRNVSIVSNDLNNDGLGCVSVTGAVSNLDILDNPCGKDTTPTYALNYNGVVTNSNVRGNDFSRWATAAISLGATPTNLNLFNNTGVNNSVPAVASASTLTFPLSPNFTLTGTTAVTTVAIPLAQGANYTFTATNANPGTWTAGATIGTTFTPQQNVPVNCYWDGTKVWCASGAMASYTPAGAIQTDARTVFGKCTLGTSCAVTFTVPFTSTTSYYCSGTDQTAAAAVRVVNTSASVATFTGTGTDVVSFVCIGND